MWVVFLCVFLATVSGSAMASAATATTAVTATAAAGLRLNLMGDHALSLIHI